jgi:hypothetical protein
MYPEFNAQSPEPFTARNKNDDDHMIPNPQLAVGGFNIWWQKNAAQNMAMVTEACDLIHQHRLVSLDVQNGTAFALKAKEMCA